MKGRQWAALAMLLCGAGLLFGGVAEKPKVIEYKAKVDQVLHHDPSAYTQGLFFYGGVLYESTGQYGESSLRQVDLSSGRVLKHISLDRQFFGEGACELNGLIYQLTWMEHVCFVYDAASLTLVGQLYVPTEGWGLTTNGEDLILSDGSSNLYFLDPTTFQERRRVVVTRSGKALPYLNELEYIDGKVWANVYGTNYLVIIDPKDGQIQATVDCRNILPARYTEEVDVLNGIAYDPKAKAVYITGKLWPQLYRIALIEK